MVKASILAMAGGFQEGARVLCSWRSVTPGRRTMGLGGVEVRTDSHSSSISEF